MLSKHCKGMQAPSRKDSQGPLAVVGRSKRGWVLQGSQGVGRGGVWGGGGA